MSNKFDIAKRPSGPRVHPSGSSRRDFLKVGSAAGVMGAICGLPLSAVMNPAWAAGKYEGQTVVFTSWGGSYQDAEKVAYCDPFEQKTGARVIQDGPMNNAKFRTMVEAGNPDWDVVEVTEEFLYDGVTEDLFEKLDHSKIHTDRIDPVYVHPYGIGNIAWSFTIGYNTDAFKTGEHPQSWADIFDIERFPGTRAIRDRVASMLEMALMADGISMDKVYDVLGTEDGVKRAFAKLDTIKDHSIFWQSNAKAQQMFVDGEVTCGVISHGRAFDAANKGGPVAVEWNENIQFADYFVIPKGNA